MKSLNKVMGKIIRFLQLYQNIVIGAIVIIFSAVMMFQSSKIQVDKFASSVVDNAAFMPRLIFAILIVIGVVLVVMGVQEIGKNKGKLLEGEALEKASRETLRSLGALCILLAYILCFKPVGFVISSILFLVGMMYYMTKKEDRKPVLFIIIAVVMTLVVYFCFQKFLYIYLPNGILKGVF
ncbi:MAG: tripartite tricarboxylate transporter TctB family protein [Lachnospiraceae bacterium]|nr:tripartite tricarboxylate transporter TctB family protein [Lachnospiraceae bacterium]